MIYTPGDVVTVALDLLDEWNYRTTYNEFEIKVLADDIALNGLQQPPTAMPLDNGRWRLTCGHRRTRAMRVAGLTVTRLIVADPAVAEVDHWRASVRDNELRAEVSKGDRAKAALHARDHYELSVEHIAHDLGLSVGGAKQLIRCAERLSDSALDDWSSDLIGDTMAYTLCRIEKDRQHALLQLARSEKFGVKAWDQLVSKVLSAQEADSQAGMFDMAAFTMQVADMGAEAKLAARQKALDIKAQREQEQQAMGELIELRALARTAAGRIKRKDPKLAARLLAAAA